MRFLVNILDLYYFLKNNINIKIKYKNKISKDRQFLDSIDLDACNKEDSKYTNEFLSYIKNSNLNKTILLCEMNNFHFELLDSIVYYFSKIGFYTDILLRKDSHYKNTNKNIFFLDLKDMICAINTPYLQKYDFIFFNTITLSLNTQIHIPSIIKPKSKYGILGIYHTISDIERFGDYENYTCNRYFALRPMQYKNLKLDALSCSVETKSRYKNTRYKTSESNAKITTFISIGFPVYHLNFRLNLYKIIKSLLNKRITNFRFILVGRAKFKIDASFKDFVLCFTNPSHEELENILHIYHPAYVFGLFDRFAHRHYLEECTSGLRQFCLMYNIPMLINEPFGESFGFDSTNAIIFKNNPMRAIKKALEIIHTEKYNSLCDNLLDLNNKLNQDSINNLHSHIAHIKKSLTKS